MIQRNEEFTTVYDIMTRFGGKVSKVRTKTRGCTAGGYLVHVLIIDHQIRAAQGVTNSHGPGVSWDEMYMESTNGGLQPIPKRQALFVKDESKEPKERKYTFRGIYEIQAESTGARIIFRRDKTEVDETLDEWRIDHMD